jgi:hypothetical protein
VFRVSRRIHYIAAAMAGRGHQWPDVSTRWLAGDWVTGGALPGHENAVSPHRRDEYHLRHERTRQHRVGDQRANGHRDGHCHRGPPWAAVGRLPEGIATDARTDTIYVTNSFISNNKPRTVSVISGSTNAVTATVPVGIERLAWRPIR